MNNNKIPNDIEDLYPLADIQKGMVYHSIANPDKFIYYSISIKYVKFKNFDAGIFKKAFELLVDKHSILRTGFNMYDFEEPIQIVYKHIVPDIKHFDIPGMNKEEQQAYLKKIIADDKQKLFNISNAGVLWKLRTLNLGNDNICIAWISHHAVMDGWSSASLMAEIKTTYLKLIENPVYVPQKLKNSYKVFVVEQIIEKKKKENIEFWQRELEDYKRIHFPGSGPHLNNPGVKNTISKNLGEDLAAKLKQTAQKFNTSLKHLCFGAYAYMLNMFSYENDLVVGLISNSRPSCPDGDKIIGCFLNTIPVRIKIPYLLRWQDYIRLIENKLLELKKYDKFSFLEIVKSIGEIQHNQNPIVDTIFNYTDFHIYDQESTQKKITKVSQYQESGKIVGSDDSLKTVENLENGEGVGGTHTLFDCNITVTGGMFRIVFDFDTGLINAKRVADLCLSFEKILHKFVEEANCIIKKDDLLSDEEKRDILYNFNNTQTEYPAHKTIHQLVAEQVERTPNSIAVFGPSLKKLLDMQQV
ncbi:MAG: condensation domain-containing protein, partial [Acidobacteria bacterium]|nr:condensation domain-containing protein [Acidobacteriota bacterium]